MNCINIEDLKSRVKEKPYSSSFDWPLEWGGGVMSVNDEGDVDYSNLSDEQKMFLYVYSYNVNDICPSKKGIMKKFNWTDYKVKKMYRALQKEGMDCVPVWSERTGLLSGKGYRCHYND